MVQFVVQIAVQIMTAVVALMSVPLVSHALNFNVNIEEVTTVVKTAVKEVHQFAVTRVMEQMFVWRVLMPVIHNYVHKIMENSVEHNAAQEVRFVVTGK